MSAASGPNDLTVDAPPESKSGSVCRLRLHSATGNESGTISSSVLQQRLRISTLILFGGFAAFLVWHGWFLDLARPLALTLFLSHLVVTLILGLVGFLLSGRSVWPMCRLRWMELAAFGAPAAYFTLLQYVETTVGVERTGLLAKLDARWALLIFTYALFIPNYWRRALAVCGTIIAAPVVMISWLAWSRPDIAQALLTEGAIFELLLRGGLTTVLSVIGVHTINELRQEIAAARQMGQYHLKKLLGSGGMGDVFLAEHSLLKRPCAVKVIRSEKAGDPKVLARFEREVQATARLSHWNTISIFDYGRTDEGTFYYVMEYLPGMNLDELVSKCGALPIGRAVHLVRQACEALQEAHDNGLIHRDIKPANIITGPCGGMFDVAKLLDFGLVKPLENLTGESITQDGAITGSPLFMSPEQATGDREPDPRSDIYSMGAVIYYLVTGRAPFEYEKPLKVLVAHIHEQPPRPTQFRPDLSEEMEELVLKCLAKNPDERFQSAIELADALASLAHDPWSRDDAKSWWTDYQANGNQCPVPAMV